MAFNHEIYMNYRNCLLVLKKNATPLLSLDRFDDIYCSLLEQLHHSYAIVVGLICARHTRVMIYISGDPSLCLHVDYVFKSGRIIYLGQVTKITNQSSR